MDSTGHQPLSEHQKSIKRERYRRHRESGICHYCFKPAGTGKSKCVECAERKNTSQRQRNQRRIESGLCQCGHPSGPHSKRCLSCLSNLSDDNKRRYYGKKSLGVCVACGQEAALTTQTSQRKSQSPKGMRLCVRCWLKRTAIQHLGDTSEWPRLLELFEEQDGRCAYTGVPLEMGVNASIDHIMPKARFPELVYRIENLQWVTYAINVMKNDMTHEEFIETCRCVVQHQATF